MEVCTGRVNRWPVANTAASGTDVPGVPAIVSTPPHTRFPMAMRAMSTEEHEEQEPEPPSDPARSEDPPTTPCSVVWSQGRPYVLEPGSGNPRWMGTDPRGRPQALTRAQLRRRGWSHRRAS